MMSSVQIHLMLNHVPVLASVIAVAILSWGLLRKNEEVIRVSFYLLIGSALVALPVYFSGEGAEEAVEHLPAVLESLIETHENWAKIAMIMGQVLGVGALVGVIISFRKQQTPRWLAGAVLVLGLIESGVAFQTAHLGGLIRHSEIRGPAASVIKSEGSQRHSAEGAPEDREHQAAQDTEAQEFQPDQHSD
jgi:hypothetical protein